MTNPENWIIEIERLAKAALPGPYGHYPNTGDDRVVFLGKETYAQITHFGPRKNVDDGIAEAAYIAAANPSAILSILIQLRQSMARESVLRDAVEFYADRENWIAGASQTFSAIRCHNFPVGDSDSDCLPAFTGYHGGKRARLALESADKVGGVE